MFVATKMILVAAPTNNTYQYLNLLKGADKECPFSGVTKSGRVWRKVPESDARNV